MALLDVDGDEATELEVVDLLEAEQYITSSSDLPRRSEMRRRPSRCAVSRVTAISLDEVNGVGGRARMPSASNSVRTRSYASRGSRGSCSVGTSKNDSSAVPVYSG